MSSKTKVPIVAIVGRANVGKSSIFNSVLRRREAIVANEPGTTRDSISAKAEWEEHDFWLVDTAGMKDPEDDFEFTIQEQIQQAEESADVIWVVIEADAAITDDDRRVAKQALKTRKPVFLVVNKADKTPKAHASDYQRLGIKDIFLTSATQNRGIPGMLDVLIERIPKTSITTDPDRITVSLLGRPNVGKSYLFNTLAKKQQAIVADVAGTTRDINRTTVKYKKKEIELLDTAGIRRSGKIEHGIEKFSVIRTLAAIEQSDVCFLLMDAGELNTALDQKIAGMIKEAGKGLVLVVSKWDTLESVRGRAEKAEERKKAKQEEALKQKNLTKQEKKKLSKSIAYDKHGAINKDAFTRDAIAPQIQANFLFVPWASLIFTSSVTGQNVTKLFDLAQSIVDSRHTLIKTPLLNRWLHDVTDQHPPAGLKNKTPKLNYIIQEADSPTNFQVYGRDTKFLHWSYKRFMERKLREKYGFEGTPVKFWFFDSRDNAKN